MSEDYQHTNIAFTLNNLYTCYAHD